MIVKAMLIGGLFQSLQVLVMFIVKAVVHCPPKVVKEYTVGDGISAVFLGLVDGAIIGACLGWVG